MKKQFVLIMAAGALAFSACREDAGTSTETQENDSQTPDHEAGDTNDSTSASNFNYERESRDRANRLSAQISQDLRLDTATQARIRTVMYNRARQMEELEMRFSSNNRSAGYAADSQTTMSDDMMVGDNMMDSGAVTQSSMQVSGFPEDYPTRYYSELESINSNVDMEVKGFLTPQQFKMYETNREKYYSLESKFKAKDGSKWKVDGDEAKLKTDDLKLKKDGDEAKLKADDLKVKKDGDESKLKTDNVKIKREKDEVKYKSGDTKIKLEN